MNRLSCILLWQLALCLMSATLAGRDFYRILNMRKSASTNEIKKAYRKLAKELHPDKNKNDPDASSQFQELAAAYEVLGNPEKRKVYDRCGEECLKNDGTMNNEDDPFASFFGDFGDFGFHFRHDDDEHEHDTPRGANVVMDMFVILEELYTGSLVKIVRNKPVLKAAYGTRRCNCRQEFVTRNLGTSHIQMIQKTVCDECPNFKLVNEEQTLEIEVEPGMFDGQELRFIAEGEPNVDGDPGDLIIRVLQIPHVQFQRKFEDLYTNITISLQDALIGFTMDITHLDGHIVTVIREKITWPGACIRKQGEGMPSYPYSNLRGDLYITFDVDFPKKDLDDREKEKLKKIFDQSSINRVYNGF